MSENTIKTTKRKRHRHSGKDFHWLWLIINSFCALMTMFIALFFTYYLVQMLIARFFGVQSTLYFDDILFISDSDIWFPKLVLVSYTAPIFFSAFATVFFFYLHSLMRRTPYLLRLYCLWGYIIGLSLFFSSFIHGAFAYKSFKVILLWYNISNPAINYILAIFGILGLAVVGLFLGVAFLKLAPSQDLDMHKYPRKFLVGFALLPLIIGMGVIRFFLMKKLENSIPLLIVPIGILVMLVFMIIRREPIEERITIVRNLPTGRFSIWAIAFCVLALIVARYLTVKGINL
jgi:hypothetical protein